jgi:hypothetical protein
MDLSRFLSVAGPNATMVSKHPQPSYHVTYGYGLTAAEEKLI